MTWAERLTFPRCSQCDARAWTHTETLDGDDSTIIVIECDECDRRAVVFDTGSDPVKFAGNVQERDRYLKPP